MRLNSFRRGGIALAGIAAAALALSACSSAAPSDDSGEGTDAAGESYTIGISQLVQHPALDAATAGFKQAVEDAGLNVEWDEQNANGEQANAVTIAQTFATKGDAEGWLSAA